MTFKNILNKIKKFHWVWYWSGNWPLLDCVFYYDRTHFQALTKIAEIAPRIIVAFFKNGIVSELHCQEDYDRMERYLFNKFETNHDFILKSVVNYRQKVNSDLSFLKKIHKLSNLSHLPNRTLTKLFLGARKHFVYNSAMDMYDWYIEKFFVPKLEQVVREKLDSLHEIEKTAEYVVTLVTPHQPSKIFLERKELFGLIDGLKKNKPLVNFLKNKPRPSQIIKKFPSVNRLVKSHWFKYNWLPMLVNNPATDMKDIGARYNII